MNNVSLKEVFEVESKYSPFYTGGNIQWSIDGEYIFCQKFGTVSVLSVEKGVVICCLGESKSDEEKEDTINTFTACNNDFNIITHHESGLFKLWNWKDIKLIKLWKSTHKTPVVRIAHCTTKNLMASGGSDGSVRLWDLEFHVCTHNLKGVQGVTSVLAFHPNTEKDLVFAAGDDLKIHGWNIKTGEEQVLLSGHFSKVTSLSFLHDEDYLISSGRDRALILWNISSQSSARVLPVYEEIEDAFIVPNNVPLPFSKEDNNAIHVVIAGEKGVVKIWEMKTAKQVYIQENSIVLAAKEAGSLSITHLLYNNTGANFAVVTVDHNIIIHSLETFEYVKQLIGYSDEILDIVYLGDDSSHIAVASNSRDIKLYNISTMNCQLLCGHTDFVLSLTTARTNTYLFISSAKDNSIRVWLMDKESFKVSCIGSATRHTAPVNSIDISCSSNFFASISQDLCLKLWNLSHNIKIPSDLSLNVIHTTLAHQMEINSVAISPNDKMIATGSHDKTAKLWSVKDLQLLGVFRGHRRGVMCVRFSPVDKILLTTSIDCTMKIWSLTELNCLKTFEGHESSIVRAVFLSRGMQIISSGGDGLLKLWNIKTSDCVCTLDQHSSRVWGLAVSKNEKNIISGGSDSLLVIWKDVTEEKKLKAAMEFEQLVQEEQQLANFVQANRLTSALKLALKLERPFQTLKIIESMLRKNNLENLEETIRELKPKYKEELLKCAITWNTNSKNCQVAQVVVNTLSMELEHLELQTKLSSTLESMIPYTRRHYIRVTKLLQNLHLFSYTLNNMKPLVYNNELD